LTAEAFTLYDASNHALKRVLTQDIRIETELQSFVADSPISLMLRRGLFTNDETAEEDRYSLLAADAGAIIQNVCLFCASEELATVVRRNGCAPALVKLMKLRPSQRIISRAERRLSGGTH